MDNNKKTPDVEVEITEGGEQNVGVEVPMPEGFDPTSIFKPDSEREPEENFASLKDAVNAVFDTNDMTIKTVLDEKHITALVRGAIFTYRFDSETMLLLCQQLMQARVSYRGRGRRDLTTIIRSVLNREEPMQQDENRLANRLFR